MQTSDESEQVMAANSRSRRSQFPGTESPTHQGSDLPTDPLPPEPRSQEEIRPPANAPIMLVPIGQLEDSILNKLARPLEETFRRPIQVYKSLPVPKYAHNPTRSQYHSAAILKRVEELRPPEWDSAVGVVDVDLFVPEVPFIFGEADRSTRSAIISLTRLRPESGSPEAQQELLFKRLISESIHQIGLIRGLAQCPNNRCVMFYSATVQDTDKKGSTFCANCRKRLMSES